MTPEQSQMKIDLLADELGLLMRINRNKRAVMRLKQLRIKIAADTIMTKIRLFKHRRLMKQKEL